MGEACLTAVALVVVETAEGVIVFEFQVAAMDLLQGFH